MVDILITQDGESGGHGESAGARKAEGHYFHLSGFEVWFLIQRRREVWGRHDDDFRGTGEGKNGPT